MTVYRPLLMLAMLVAVILLSLAGCDRERAKNAPARVTTLRTDNTAEPEPAPATLPASRPTTSLMMVGDRECVFPAARLVLQQTTPTVDLLLFSDDAIAALSSDYSGNRYHLLFKLDITSLRKLGSVDYVVKAASMERVDTPDGIFLDGDRKQLQPYDVHVQFSRIGDDIQVDIQGMFLMFGAREEPTTPVLVPVHGVVAAPLEDPRKLRDARRP